MNLFAALIIGLVFAVLTFFLGVIVIGGADGLGIAASSVLVWPVMTVVAYFVLHDKPSTTTVRRVSPPAAVRVDTSPSRSHLRGPSP